MEELPYLRESIGRRWVICKVYREVVGGPRGPIVIIVEAI
jgi:hypothetical protein